MGTINQTAPTSDVVQSLASDTYFTQLLSYGAPAPVVWTTDVATSAFIVSPNGNVATSVILDAGSYTASGTMVDAQANTGVWSFTLTVLTQTPTPQTTVIPAVPLAPTGIEVMTPFQINPATGQVATVQNYQLVLAQHVLSVMMTAIPERVMLPTYGVGMQNYVFQPQTDLLGAEIQKSIENQLSTWEPAITVQSVTIFQAPQSPNVLNVTLTYSVIPFTGTNSITVALGGQIPTAPITTIATFSP